MTHYAGFKTLDPQWDVHDGAALMVNQTFEADVVIVGTGAGGGTAAEILVKAGRKVILVEEGPFRTPGQFDMRESTAYPSLYQESANRKTKDKAIIILQGRSVGGTTTVNWTTSFRTPPQTLAHWRDAHQVKGLSESTLEPWFKQIESRLHILPWRRPPNANNDVLYRACRQKNYHVDTIQRNVRGCANLGYCGLGCPINAKLSMLVTTIPAVLKAGATLLHRVRAERLKWNQGKVSALECVAMDAEGNKPSSVRVTLKAKQFVLAAGAIGTPALLMRSNVPDPYEQIGKRTFLHPVVISSGLFTKRINPYEGAPQSVYSDEFLWRGGTIGPLGYKLEVPPLHPVLISTVLPFHGLKHRRLMQQFPHTHAMIALGRDGFHAESPGGQVKLNADGTPVLDYPITPYLWSGFRQALLDMAELQFAAGAKGVVPLHTDAGIYKTWAQAKNAIEALPMAPLKTVVGSAHVMGGAKMGEDPKQAVVSSEGQHHHLDNLWVFDGSCFPTSLGANPQLSIYGIIAMNAAKLAGRLTQ